MDNKWRPEGWENPYLTYKLPTRLKSVDAVSEKSRLSEAKAYEAGASAMLEVLRIDGGFYFSGTTETIRNTSGVLVQESLCNLTRHRSGFIVFIPDK